MFCSRERGGTPGVPVAIADNALARRPSTRRERASLIVRGRARVRRRALVRRLAEGVDPCGDAEASCCAEWLLSRRRRMALELKRRVLEAVEEAPRSPGSTLLIREEILAQAPKLFGLAVELRSEERVAVRGLAQLERLLGDPESPLYLATEPLGLAIDRAREALRPRERGGS